MPCDGCPGCQTADGGRVDDVLPAGWRFAFRFDRSKSNAPAAWAERLRLRHSGPADSLSSLVPVYLQDFA